MTIVTWHDSALLVNHLAESSGKQRWDTQTSRLRQAKHQVHILHGLACRATTEIIKRGNGNSHVGSGIEVHGDVTVVRAQGRFGLGQSIMEHSYKRRVTIGCVVQL